SNALVEKTIKDIKEAKKATADIKKEFNSEKKKLEKRLGDLHKPDKDSGQPEEFHNGDAVTAEDSYSVGQIIQVYEDSKTALVDFNGIKFKIALDQLQKSERKSDKKKSSDTYVAFDVKSSIDVRGMRAHEAIPQVDELISNAIMSNLEQVTIIHGKGTGALRHGIHEFLDTHHTIKSYRTGTMIEGGDGVTVIEL
ncbi:Smr/MutS family protein, partial [Bacteroidota bacterium]